MVTHSRARRQARLWLIVQAVSFLCALGLVYQFGVNVLSLDDLLKSEMMLGDTQTAGLQLETSLGSREAELPVRESLLFSDAADESATEFETTYAAGLEGTGEVKKHRVSKQEDQLSSVAIRDKGLRTINDDLVAIGSEPGLHAGSVRSGRRLGDR